MPGSNLQSKNVIRNLEVDIAEDIPVVPLDASRLDQVLVNLLSNASKFSPENSKIFFKAFLNGDNLEIVRKR